MLRTERVSLSQRAGRVNRASGSFPKKVQPTAGTFYNRV